MNVNQLKAKLNKTYEKLMKLEDQAKIAEVSGKWVKWSRITDKLLRLRDKIEVLAFKYSLLDQRTKDKEERRNLNGDALTEIGLRLDREIKAELN